MQVLYLLQAMLRYHYSYDFFLEAMKTPHWRLTEENTTRRRKLTRYFSYRSHILRPAERLVRLFTPEACGKVAVGLVIGALCRD